MNDRLPLKRVARLKTLKRTPRHDDEVITLENIQSKTGKLLGLASAADISSELTEFSKGDVLFNKLRPYLAKVYPAQNIGLCTSEMLVLAPDPKKIEQRYLFYYLLSKETIDSVNMATYGTKMPRANWDFVGSMQISVPARESQQNLIAFLDERTSKIDKASAKKKQLLSLLEEKRLAFLRITLTKGLDSNSPMIDSGVVWIGKIPKHWTTQRIKALAQIKRGASPRPIEDPKYFDDNGEYAWTRIADVTRQNKYLLNAPQKLSLLGSSLSVKLQPGELFLSIAATVGKPMITKIKCCIHDGFIYFKNPKVNREFLYYIFTAGEAYKGLGKLGTQLNLNSDTVGNIVIPVPPPSEQKDIVASINEWEAKFEDAKQRILASVSLLEEYKNSLISNAVAGKVKKR